MEITLKSLTVEHWKDVERIYLEGIQTGQATYETQAPTWESWNRAHLETCRWVAAIENQVCGWAALSPVSGRCVYAGVAEDSVYIDQRFRGKGVGYRLLEKAIHYSEALNIWTLEAGVFPENTASIKLHKKLGFRVVGIREKLGQLNGIWRDVTLLERRSKIAGR